VVYNTHMFQGLKRICAHRWVQVLIVITFLAVLVYLLFFKSITITPQMEAKRITQLELTKQSHQLSTFTSDGCSGGISKNWATGIENFSSLSNSIASEYSNLYSVPFEAACVKHDRLYHAGTGGYSGRLVADNQLRLDIMQYGIDRASEIQQRTGLARPEQAIYLYEVIAETVYRGVRLGGAPCTGEPYAWGYGYNNGNCIDQ